MIYRRHFVRKKSQVPRQAQHKIRKQAVQTSSKAVGKTEAVGKTDDDEGRGCRPMTVFPEFATPADSAYQAYVASKVRSGPLHFALLQTS
jgi:hypothetical protein